MDNVQEIQKLFDIVDEATDELVALQQELVRIQSVNTGAPDSGNETEVCRLLEQRFNATAIRCLRNGSPYSCSLTLSCSASCWVS